MYPFEACLFIRCVQGTQRFLLNIMGNSHFFLMGARAIASLRSTLTSRMRCRNPRRTLLWVVNSICNSSRLANGIRPCIHNRAKVTVDREYAIRAKHTHWCPNQLREIVLTKGPVLSLPYLSRIFPRLEW